jgi:putative membrane protein
MLFLYLKAIHIIFVVTWFAGLFYIVRLFIYHTEAQQLTVQERDILSNQFKLMSKRLWYGITWPSAILTLILATSLLYSFPEYLKLGWMHVKLLFVVFLYGYHFYCHYIFRALQNDTFKYTSTQLRIWNEVATLFLVAVIFIVVLKNAITWIWAVLGLFLFAAVLMLAIKIYKKVREK